MMKTVRTAALLAMLLFAATASYAAETAQQQKMKDCNAEATQKGMKGSDRQSFMKTCLSAGSAPQAHANSQQMKMKSCNSEAAAKKLSGDARKQFMSSCLKGS